MRLPPLPGMIINMASTGLSTLDRPALSLHIEVSGTLFLLLFKYIWLIPLFSLRAHDKWQSLWVQKLGRSLRSPWGLTYFMFSSLVVSIAEATATTNLISLK